MHYVARVEREIALYDSVDSRFTNNTSVVVSRCPVVRGKPRRKESFLTPSTFANRVLYELISWLYFSTFHPKRFYSVLLPIQLGFL